MKRLTDALKEVRGCRDVRVLGHVMVAGNRVVSMDERGLIR
jgi:DNA repair protein RadC